MNAILSSYVNSCFLGLEFIAIMGTTSLKENSILKKMYHSEIRNDDHNDVVTSTNDESKINVEFKVFEINKVTYLSELYLIQ